jgi:5-methylcytosine-specific restriction protein A
LRPPKWHRDEIILALALYFRLEKKNLDSNNHYVLELSQTLNKLPIHKDISNIKFRNENGVAMKLNNFKAIDPLIKGGLSSYSKQDKAVFMEFHKDVQLLNIIASKINNVSSSNLVNKLNRISDDEDDEVHSVKEGRVIYKLHKYRERDNSINKKKKEATLRETGKLECEVCNFDFNQKYGELGFGYIECHHKVPLSKLDSEGTTKLTDLALVCSNCHRMLHKRIDVLSISELSKIIQS